MNVMPRWARRAATLVLLFGAVFGSLLGGAGTASAHAALRATDPQDGAVLKRAPGVVTLRFTEGVTLSDDSVRVLDPDNRRVNRTVAEHVGGASGTVRVKLRSDLPRGTFTVAWRVVSADSHPISGAFTFSIGKPSATDAVREPPPENTATSVLYGIGRYVAYGSLALVVGVAVFVLGCWLPGARLRALRRIVAVAWSALLLSTVVLLLLRGPYESGTGPGGMLDLPALGGTLGTRPGIALAVRLLLVALAGVFLALVATGRIPRATVTDDGKGAKGAQADRLRRGGFLAAGGLLAGGLAVTWAAAEHASAGIQVPAAMVSAVLHLLAMAVWLGGLAGLLTALFRAPSGRCPSAAVVTRFSRIAFGSVVVLVLTGVYQSWRQVGSWDALLTTSYGKLLTLKVYAVLLLLLAAARSRRWTARLGALPAAEAVSADAEHDTERTPEPVGAGALAAEHGRAPAVPTTTHVSGPPRATSQGTGPGHSGHDEPFRRLRRSVLAEVVIGLVVLAFTAVLTGTQPGRAVAETSASTRTPDRTVSRTLVPFGVDTAKGRVRGSVQVVLEPGQVGANTVQAVVFGRDGSLAIVPELRVTFTLREHDIGPIDAELADRHGYWGAEELRLPLPGTWTMKVTVRVSEIDQVTETAEVRIGRAPGRT